MNIIIDTTLIVMFLITIWIQSRIIRNQKQTIRYLVIHYNTMEQEKNKIEAQNKFLRTNEQHLFYQNKIKFLKDEIETLKNKN